MKITRIIGISIVSAIIAEAFDFNTWALESFLIYLITWTGFYLILKEKRNK